MFFKELVKQHRVHRFVTYGVGFSLNITIHQIWVHLFHFLGHKAKPWNALGIKLLLVAESNRFPSDASDQGSCLAVTDPNGVGLYPKTGVTDIDIVISRGEIQAGTRAQGDVM